MFLIFLGLLLIVGSFFFFPRTSPFWPYKQYILIGGVLIFLLGGFSSMIKIIEPGQVGVQTLFGKVDNNPLYSGLNIVNPLVEVETYDAKTRAYTMSKVSDEGAKSGDDAIEILTSDGLNVKIDLTVLYSIIPIKTPYIRSTIGNDSDLESKIVRPETRTSIRNNAVYFDAVSLFSSKRAEFQNRIVKDLTDILSKRGMTLEKVLIRNITLPPSVSQSIESKINAEQEAQKMQFVLQKERQEADRKRVEAQGIADYQKIISSGLNDKMLQYENIKVQKELVTSPNSKIIIMGSGRNPMILSDK